MDFLARVGLRKSGPATPAAPALGDWAQLILSQLGGKYQELVRQFPCFIGMTAATGVAPGTAVGTTAAHTLANPAGNSNRLVILRQTVGYVSGTLGAGVIHWVANIATQAAAVTGTVITPVDSRVGFGRKATGALFTTSTLPASPTVMRPFASLQASLATTAVGPWQLEEDVDGEIQIEPGAAVSLEATAAAGTSPLLVYGTFWAEIPI